jgi:hypothetical protein
MRKNTKQQVVTTGCRSHFRRCDWSATGGGGGGVSIVDDVEDIAAATLDAAQSGLNQARNDSGLCNTFYLLTQLVLAARDETNWRQRFSELGISLGDIATCLGAGGLGAMATTPEIDGWNRTIEKPSWNPPDAVFGPVWTTLYIMMAISAWLVWRTGEVKAPKLPLSLFGIPLLRHVGWSRIFFHFH